MLLIGMFIYDIIMVFGTRLITSNGCSVMLQVVTGVDCNSKTIDGPSYPIAPLEMSHPERVNIFLKQKLNIIPFLDAIVILCSTCQ